MWAWRSFLRRPNTLITSRPRPVHRHDATRTTVLGKSLNASRGHASDATIGDSRADALESATSKFKSSLLRSDQDRLLCRTAATKRHLYLVLDDHRDEYGIYKLDMDRDPDGDVGSDSARLLPEPAVIRLEVPKSENQRERAQFTTVGSCIITTGAGCGEYPGQLTEEDAVTYVYDAETAALSTACYLPEHLWAGYDVAVDVGNRLYAFDWLEGGLHCMTTDRSDGDGNRWPEWRPFTGSSRCFWSYGPLTPPFHAGDIRAHAVHPLGRAILVSFMDKSIGDAGTFEYDTVSSEWMRIGNWRLPFRGCAGYDGELEAWVGLHADDDDDDDEEEEARRIDRYVCACRVPSSGRPPEWKVGREKMLLEDPGWRRVDAKLVHMGERDEYCPVERLRWREGADEKECLRDGDECLLRVTTFRVEYGDDGELIVATAHRRTRSYGVPRYREHFEAQAF